MNESSKSVETVMRELGVAAKSSAIQLATASTAQKNRALLSAATSIRASFDGLEKANGMDMEFGRKKGISDALLDRLMLNPERIESIAQSLEQVAELADPVGVVIADWERPSGLRIQRVRSPLGVVGVIYESRPNVTADAGALCLKSGNAVILRGGSESFHSNQAIHQSLLAGLRDAELPEEVIQLVPTRDRAAVGEMLGNMTQFLDVIVPRGGKGLVARVKDEARVPVFAHLEGVCHIFVDASADLEKTRRVVLNAKMRRTGICGAAECLLVHRDVSDSHVGPVVNDLIEAGCEVRGDQEVQAVDSRVLPASHDDWGREYLAPIIAVRMVADIDIAIQHIREYGSGHTEAILTENAVSVQRFFSELDSAILMHNASTQFADGGEFGMGAEIGIATGKMHARGPVGVEQLTSFKYQVTGDGTIRA